MASAIYTAPRAPKPDTRPQLAAGIAVAGAIVFAFVGWMIYLESEKNRSCCGYSWCACAPFHIAMRRAAAAWAAQASQSALSRHGRMREGYGHLLRTHRLGSAALKTL